MIDSETIKHDLTLLIVNERCEDKTPENLIKAYHETYKEVHEAYNLYSKSHRPKGQIPNRSDVL